MYKGSCESGSQLSKRSDKRRTKTMCNLSANTTQLSKIQKKSRYLHSTPVIQNQLKLESRLKHTFLVRFDALLSEKNISQAILR